MSCGIVVCSKCRREVHQNGAKTINEYGHERTGWTHCEDGSPRCEGASSDYASTDKIVGKWCGMDA